MSSTSLIWQAKNEGETMPRLLVTHDGLQINHSTATQGLYITSFEHACKQFVVTG